MDQNQVNFANYVDVESLEKMAFVKLDQKMVTFTGLSENLADYKFGLLIPQQKSNGKSYGQIATIPIANINAKLLKKMKVGKT